MYILWLKEVTLTILQIDLQQISFGSLNVYLDDNCRYVTT